jgi:hypothetical protein
MAADARWFRLSSPHPSVGFQIHVDELLLLLLLLQCMLATCILEELFLPLEQLPSCGQVRATAVAGVSY